MRNVVPDLRITAVENLEVGEVFVDPADEQRHVADVKTKNRYKSGYLVIVEDPPDRSR